MTPPEPAPLPEAWLRGPLPGFDPLVMPAAHALLGAAEDLARAAADLAPAELWARPGGAASVGFHLRHVAGVTDRMLTYARGEGLSAAQFERLAAEGVPGDPPEGAESLLAAVRAEVDRALAVLRDLPLDTLAEPRPVGRAGLPSTVWGLLFHAAEHAQRHAGQAITTARVVRATGPV